jgi:hypothetical protein
MEDKRKNTSRCDRTVPQIRAAVEGRMQMQCPKCGNDNRDDVLICGSCGFILTKAHEARPKPSKESWVLPVIEVLLIALAAGLVILLKPAWAFVAALLGFCSVVSDIKRNRKKQRIEV